MKWCKVYKCWYRDIEKVKEEVSACSRSCEECAEEKIINGSKTNEYSI